MKRIAVFTSHIYNQMSVLMQQGIEDAARKHGIKVVFFASFGDSYTNLQYGDFSTYDEGDTVSYDIANLDVFDGVIAITTFVNEITKKHMDQLLSKTTLPVVNIGDYDEKYLNVICDNERSFNKMVNHLIEKHDCKDIYHISGDQNLFFARERFSGYKRALEEHGIHFDEDKVVYGNLWYNSGPEALDIILERCRKNGKEFPDAIACANDYCALGLITACKERNIRIPEDFIVTGFDAISEALNGFPTVTTIRQPFYDSGYEAVMALLKIFEGGTIDKDIQIVGELLENQSCGCGSKTVDAVEDYRDFFIKKLDNTIGIAQSTTNLMLRVANADTLEECFKEVCNNAKTAIGFKDMLVCLAPGWDKQRILDENFSNTDEEMTLVNGYLGDREISNITFRKKDLLPLDLMENPEPYYIFSIHHLQYYMGYVIVTPELEFRDQRALQSWFVDLGVILDRRRIQRDLELTVSRLEFLSNRDMLTEIYNRRGLEECFTQYLDECIKNKAGLAVITIDMDDLKYINDNFGHNEGDYGLKTIAYALSRTSDGNEICARAGGDEFTVIAKNYTEEKAQEYISKVRSLIEQKVSLDEKPFKVVISCGVHIDCLDDSFDGDSHEYFEECIRDADKLMYSEKRQHKKGRGRTYI